MGENIVSDYYRQHHAGGTGAKRYGFTFGGEERARWFTARLGTGKSVLDVGCRDGMLTRHFIPGNRVTGIDVDEEALARIRAEHGIQAVAVNLNGERLPFPACHFDAVTAGEVLEHLQFPDVVVGEVRRVLKPGGLFLGSIPNAFRLPNRIKFLLGREFETDPTHLHHFSTESLKKLLAGFVDVEIEYLLSRYLRLSPRLMGNVIVFSCRK